MSLGKLLGVPGEGMDYAWFYEISFWMINLGSILLPFIFAAALIAPSIIPSTGPAVLLNALRCRVIDGTAKALSASWAES